MAYPASAKNRASIYTRIYALQTSFLIIYSPLVPNKLIAKLISIPKKLEKTLETKCTVRENNITSCRNGSIKNHKEFNKQTGSV